MIELMASGNTVPQRTPKITEPSANSRSATKTTKIGSFFKKMDKIDTVFYAGIMTEKLMRVNGCRCKFYMKMHTSLKTTATTKTIETLRTVRKKLQIIEASSMENRPAFITIKGSCNRKLGLFKRVLRCCLFIDAFRC